jgi:hypothetical protein
MVPSWGLMLGWFIISWDQGHASNTEGNTNAVAATMIFIARLLINNLLTNNFLANKTLIAA